MWPAPLLPLLLFLLCSGTRTALAQASDGVVIAQADLQGLQAVRAALVDHRGRLSSWNGTGLDACSGAWAGIRCVNGKVIAIQLPFKSLGGSVSDKIGQLAGLRKLSLHDNAIGGQIPAALGFLQELRGLYLFNNRFSGAVPPSLGNCRALQTLDLSNNQLVGGVPAALGNATGLYRLVLSENNLTGVIPGEIANLQSLVFLFLSNNNLSGHVPSAIGGLRKLQELDLSDNQLDGDLPLSMFNLSSLAVLSLKGNDFGGEIPPAIGNMSALSVLDLSMNNFSGEIPTSIGGLRQLDTFNVSYNHLSGPVPIILSQKFNSSSFVGNLELCGYSASAPCPSAPPSQPPSSPASPEQGTRKLTKKEIILAVVGIAILFLFLISCVLVICLCKRGGDSSGKKAAAGAGNAGKSTKPGTATAVSTESTDGGGKLVHFDGPLAFTADDLLCATAEIMGKSTYGTVYKATLEDGSHVAVKRLREKTARGVKEFEAEVSALGKIRHPNLLALRAFYLGPKGEKLLVFDYMPKGSLAGFLHARAPDTTVSWATRMKIAIGVARGLEHLHTTAGVVHGNLTSSNILLDDDASPKIADYGLSRLMVASASSNVIPAAGAQGYRAPELSKIKKANPKTDVYSLGVVILELLTGKAPSDTTNGLELPQWVASVVEEEWTHEVFDVELIRDAAAGPAEAGDELVNTLKVALHCVDPSPAARPELKQVIAQLEEIMPSLAAPAESSSAPAVPTEDVDPSE